MAEGVVARGVAAGVVDLKVHDLRDFTTDRHRVVDDVPYGGGPGMVLKPEPLSRAVEHLKATRGTPGAIVLTSPQGRALTQARGGAAGADWATWRSCAVATRAWTSGFASTSATEEISIGDYVLSGGELAAMVIIDAVAGWCRAWWATSSRSARIRSRAACSTTRTTRGRRSSRGWKVPDVLLSGHHAEIDAVAAAARRCGARWNGGRICWMAPTLGR